MFRRRWDRVSQSRDRQRTRHLHLGWPQRTGRTNVVHMARERGTASTPPERLMRISRRVGSETSIRVRRPLHAFVRGCPLSYHSSALESDTKTGFAVSYCTPGRCLTKMRGVAQRRSPTLRVRTTRRSFRDRCMRRDVETERDHQSNLLISRTGTSGDTTQS